MLILGIDTSGKMASVSLMQDDVLLAENSVYTTLTHSQIIMPMCKKLLESVGKTLQDVNRIVVSCGPGSYTGLRIGISGVKAMCFALNIGCNGISTLESLAYNVFGFDGVICSIMKARLDLVYCGLFQSNMKSITRYSDDCILEKSMLFEKLSNIDKNIILVGDGAEDFYSSYEFKSNVALASVKDRLQSASSLCEIARNLEPQTPQDLQALYLQPTKAEKDLKSNNR
ncbi:MAG: tRNA (adenosine(37)-N6)-threonylcarbamoyltransferase complex dimerization subunit type 1 TsaB [Ruminococcus sp.]|nr:tRNA (adenosine(37)-N6)-threonylcarbamoyltransferase complex dimerization subunit type 1 TsaB [Ruminococcus sp.]